MILDDVGTEKGRHERGRQIQQRDHGNGPHRDGLLLPPLRKFPHRGRQGLLFEGVLDLQLLQDDVLADGGDLAQHLRPLQLRFQAVHDLHQPRPETCHDSGALFLLALWEIALLH